MAVAPPRAPGRTVRSPGQLDLDGDRPHRRDVLRTRVSITARPRLFTVSDAPTFLSAYSLRTQSASSKLHPDLGCADDGSPAATGRLDCTPPHDRNPCIGKSRKNGHECQGYSLGQMQDRRFGRDSARTCTEPLRSVLQLPDHADREVSRRACRLVAFDRAVAARHASSLRVEAARA
jgi:hypothetical protein